MIFTVYIDESDTHQGSPTIIMSGWIGNARQWELYERRLRNLQQTFGFSIFHAKKFKDSDGEFANWSRQKKGELINALRDLADTQLSGGFSARLSNEEYVRDYLGDGTKPKKLRLDTRYGLLFRLCVSHVLNEMMAGKYGRKGPSRNDTINVVLEQGDSNSGDAVRVFQEIHDVGLFPETKHMLGSISLATKEICPPLAAADFLAHTISLAEKLRRRGHDLYASMTEPPKPGVVSKISLITPSKGALAGARDQIFTRDAERIASGQRASRTSEK